MQAHREQTVMLTKLLRLLFGMSQLGVLKWDIKRQPAAEDYRVYLMPVISSCLLGYYRLAGGGWRCCDVSFILNETTFCMRHFLYLESRFSNFL